MGSSANFPKAKNKEECRRALGDVIGIVARHLIFRVYRQYPELAPDK
jgi:hypothetical protein